jgi:hypothetical protein
LVSRGDRWGIARDIGGDVESQRLLTCPVICLSFGG